MATKIEGVLTGTDNGPGYELGNGKGWCDFWEGKERKFGKGKSNATLIEWGQSQHERVFTESEVVAILRECEYQLETLSIGKVKVGLTGVLHGRSISDPA
jgi:hypothetical protein